MHINLIPTQPSISSFYNFDIYSVSANTCAEEKQHILIL